MERSGVLPELSEAHRQPSGRVPRDASWWRRGLRDLTAAYGGGIGLRLLGAVLLFSSVLTLALSATQLYVDYDHEVGEIEERLDQIERSALGSVAASLWALDEHQLKLQLEGLLQLPAIVAAEVRENAPPQRKSLVVTAGEPGAHPALRRGFPIRHGSGDAEQRIGMLQVEASLAGVYRDLANKALLILVGQGAKTFLVSLFILMVFHRLVTRHLHAVSRHAHAYDLRTASPPLSLARARSPRPDELDDLVAAFNAMATGLEAAYREIHETNRQLEHDIEARRRVEAALRDSEQRLRDYAETASDWFWVTDQEHRLTYISEVPLVARQYADLMFGQQRWDYALDVEQEADKWREHRAALDRHEPFRDFVFRRQLGPAREGYISISGKPVFDADGRFTGYRGVAADVTERHTQARERAAFDARLQQAGKMEAIGRLAGGIAHDFGNLLGAATGFAKFLTEDLAAGSEPHRFAERILQVCQRGKALVEQLLALARAGDIERSVLDLVAVVQGGHDLLRAALPRSTALVIEVDEPSLPVVGNEGQLNQLLFNLSLNAKDALGGEPGSITIRLARMRARAGWLRAGMHLVSGELAADGEYACLTLSDTGPGIDPAILTCIFEPFFSTKPRGRGTGLGLAMVHGIVSGHGGALAVESTLGEGTTFSIYLPFAPGTPDAADRAAPQGAVGGRERILIIDDQSEVGDALAIGLERLGYTAESTSDPRAALARFGATPDAWDVVVADHVMPELTGLALIAAMKAVRPSVVAVLYTASTDVPCEPGGAGGPDAVLRKPLSPDEVAARVRTLLDAAAAAAGRPDRP
jgi:PAS domain S-box-containing protein